MRLPEGGPSSQVVISQCVLQEVVVHGQSVVVHRTEAGLGLQQGETILNPARQLIDELNATGAVLVGRRTAEWWLMSAGGLQSQ